MLTKEEYERKRQARYERLIAAAEKAGAASAQSLKDARAMADVIPFGQPILVGHHSEKRDRNYRGRIENKYRRGFELAQKAEEYRSRAASVEANTAIYSDDPEATEKISDKLADMLKEQAIYKAVNAAHKKYLKDPASLDKSDLPDEWKNTIRNYTPQYSWEPHPIPPYRLTNLSANIRRMKQRAAVVEKKQAMQDEDFEINGIRVEGRPGENRIRLYYPARVDRETFDLLRRHGFRVLRSAGEGAFSAYYNNNARYFVQTHVRKKDA